jgi:hypothetical protein
MRKYKKAAAFLMTAALTIGSLIFLKGWKKKVTG